MIKTYLIIVILVFCTACQDKNSKSKDNTLGGGSINPLIAIDFDTIRFTKGFDFPVGKPDAKAYYNAQKFGENNHLGEDWNGLGGGNSDLNDPIYAIANGYVIFAKDIGGGWGNVIRVVHYINKNQPIESLFAHCDTILVKKGDYVEKGKNIATIGNNKGQYWAHLHLELRNDLNLPIGEGYSADTKGYIHPTDFINANREE